MDKIGPKSDIGPFVALGADVGMPSDGVHGRVVVFDGGDRLCPVTLAAGNPGPDRVEVPGLFGMALDTAVPIVEL
jgi:hypothetical protein